MRHKIKKNIVLGGGLFVGFIVVLIINAFFVNQKGLILQTDLSNISEMKSNIQSFPKRITSALEGDPGSFIILRNNREDFKRRLEILREDHQTTMLDPLWETIVVDTNEILGSQSSVFFGKRVLMSLSGNLGSIQEQYSELFDQINQDPRNQDLSVYKLLIWPQQLLGNLSRALEGKNDAMEKMKAFDSQMQEWVNLSAHIQARGTITEVQKNSAKKVEELFFISKKDMDNLMNCVSNLSKARLAEDKLSDNIEKTTNALRTLEGTLKNELSIQPYNKWIMYVFPALSFFMFVYTLTTLYRQGGEMLLQGDEENKNNQEKIKKLLQELSAVANGDLTIHATVMPGMTGDIAVSVNYALDALRKLVRSINLTASSVSTAVVHAQAVARDLEEESENQSREIIGATASVNAITSSIEQVSMNAAQSSLVAEKSVNIANNGAMIVKNTISGMGRIREQIQETAKRIKRLGESSQEIGEMVSLIDDISDQTNILSLNAAIQAAMAGDAGRGFAVVADEVQRLAERSGRATKDVEMLVKTVLTDINQAIISMEHTTSEVVLGAQLANDAGAALEKVESVSRHLADLIENISAAAQQQAVMANKISQMMSVIENISKKAAMGTSETTDAIENVSNFVEDLRASVAGFNLPRE